MEKDYTEVYVVSISWDDCNGTEFRIDSTHRNLKTAQERMNHLYESELSDFLLRNDTHKEDAEYGIKEKYAYMYMKSSNFDEVRIEINTRVLY